LTLPIPATFALVGAAIVIPVAIGTALLARSWSSAERRRFEVSLAAASVALLVVSKAIEAQHGLATWAWLPLHVCDVSTIASVLALLQGGSLWRATTLYFGLGLSTFALLFPDLDGSPASIAFWVFWLRHGAIVVAGCYDVIARGYRPTWDAYARWCAFGAAYVAMVSLVNALAHTNFAFIANQTLQSSTILESFGEWPARSVVMLGLALIHAAAITVLVRALPPARAFDPTTRAHR
jgi:hypothetical integral membrane protein (TIGR02206 family)